MPGTPAHLFGKQLRKQRAARGITLPELAVQTGVNAGHLSRIENGKRPPTEKVSLALDEVFGGDNFFELYEEMKTWAPAGFRDWPEYEDKAARLLEFSPVVPGMLQTPDYARAMLSVHPGATAEVIATRLAARLERQKRVLFRDEPPTAWFIIDATALYRGVGSAEVMAGQMAHLGDVGALPNVTLQVLPPVAHPATQGGFLIADSAAFAETVVGGYVHTGAETVRSLDRLFDTLRAECYRASDSAKIIKRAGAQWTSASQPTQAATAGTA